MFALRVLMEWSILPRILTIFQGGEKWGVPRKVGFGIGKVVVSAAPLHNEELIGCVCVEGHLWE